MIRKEKAKNQQVKNEKVETKKIEQEVGNMNSKSQGNIDTKSQGNMNSNKQENINSKSQGNMNSKTQENMNTQVILVEENEYHHSYNWRLTKKSIGTFLVIAFSMVFFFLLFRIDKVAVFINKCVSVLQPIILGIVIAYLLNPIQKFVESKILSLRKNPGQKYRKFSKNMGILLSITLGILIVTFLVMTVVPQFISSAKEIVMEIPDKMNKLVDWVNGKFSEDTEINRTINEVFNASVVHVENWMQTELLNTLNVVAVSFTSGVLGIVNILKNIFVGIFVAVYVMASKDHFVSIGKKISYAFLPFKKANVLFEIMQYCHKTYSGFINGKLIDSFIIGMLCYAGVSFMDLEKYKMLISVIIGVTNIIPFFGPFIGGIPCVILIMLIDFKTGIYLAIFIMLLQQLDGNLIGPMILGDSTGLSPFWVIFSILVSGGLFGFVGMLIGVPTFAVIYYLIKRVVEAKLEKKGMPTETNRY